jgi:hypothetical protein
VAPIATITTAQAAPTRGRRPLSVRIHHIFVKTSASDRAR